MLLSVAAAATATTIPLATFDGAPSTTFKFVELNDPVMGGRSTGSWSVNASGGFGVFDGEVVDVPSLQAPGFIKASADGKFADVSAALGGALVLTLRTSTPAYAGYRASFYSGVGAATYACAGGGGIPFSRGCFKANFSVPAGAAFSTVRIPFDSFSDMWSSATGDPTKTCADDGDVCPTAKVLSSIKRVELWGEGKLGKLHLEVQSIAAELPTAADAAAAARHLAAAAPAPAEAARPPAASHARASSRPPAAYDECSGAVQPSLRYNVSSRTEPEVPVPVGAGESLATAVCCDSRTKMFAEPQFLYASPDIDLFAKLAPSGATTFYDAVCGLPLFTAPTNRSAADFKADTDEHGWPSFRTAEVVADNVVTDRATGYVTSKCGTHLGTYLPDDKGARWCIDLSCVSGGPAPSVA